MGLKPPLSGGLWVLTETVFTFLLSPRQHIARVTQQSVGHSRAYGDTNSTNYDFLFPHPDMKLLQSLPGSGRADFTPAGEVHHHRGEGVHGVQEEDWKQVSPLLSTPGRRRGR